MRKHILERLQLFWKNKLLEVKMSIPFKRLKQVLKSKYYKEFSEWMEGQTTDMKGVYEDDFLRWVQELPVLD